MECAKRAKDVFLNYILVLRFILPICRTDDELFVGRYWIEVFFRYNV